MINVGVVNDNTVRNGNGGVVKACANGIAVLPDVDAAYIFMDDPDGAKDEMTSSDYNNYIIAVSDGVSPAPYMLTKQVTAHVWYHLSALG